MNSTQKTILDLQKAAEYSSILDGYISSARDARTRIETSRLKVAADESVALLFNKLSMDAASSIASSKLQDVLSSMGKGTAIGTGISIPLFLLGSKLVDNSISKLTKAKEDIRNDLQNNAPGVVASILLAGKQALTDKTSEYISHLAVAHSLNSKLRNSLDSGVKTADDVQYRQDMLHRSNAHISHLVNSLLVG
jgi:hypothetical protein